MLCLIQPRLAAAAPRAPPLNAEALYTGLPPASGLYAPFVHRTFELLDEAAIPLAPYPSPADLQLLRSGDGHGGAAPALLSVRAFSSERLRHGRLLLLDGGPSLQVLNLCFFPRLDSALPTLSADLVTLPGGSLVAIDWHSLDAELSAGLHSCRGCGLSHTARMESFAARLTLRAHPPQAAEWPRPPALRRGRGASRRRTTSTEMSRD